MCAGAHAPDTHTRCNLYRVGSSAIVVIIGFILMRRRRLFSSTLAEGV
jgi:hypothetical protein